MRIKKLMQWLLGADDESTLEYRLFLSALIVGVLVSLLGTIVSILIFSKFTVVLVASLLLVIFGVLYYFARFKGIYKPFIGPSIILAFLGIGHVWVFDGGIDGSNLMVGFVALVLALIIVKNRNRKYVISFFILLVVALYLIQLYRPDLITPFASERARWLDSLITALYSAVFLFFIITFLHNAYSAERKKARDNELRFRALSENSQDGISRYDREYRHVYINRAGLELRGLSEEQVLGKTQREVCFLDEEQCEIFENALKKVFETKQPQNGQFSLNSSGGISYYDWRLYPEFNSENEVATVLGVSRDITDLKHSEKELLQLNIDKDRFMSILGHDLKGPLYTTLEISELLSANIREYETAELETILTEMSNSLRITYSLLEDIVNWTKAQSGKVPFQPQKLLIAETCEKVIELLGPKTKSKNIEVGLQVKKEMTVFADPDMLNTVLRNLLSNAIKFTHEDGKIIIEAEEGTDFTTLSVSDNGMGISEKNLKKLFKITEVYTTKGTAQEKGTGLGLMLCKEFVEKHGGTIRAESKEGKGSTFSFTIPTIAKDYDSQEDKGEPGFH
jgi:PAS domain S-box-containing protein